MDYTEKKYWRSVEEFSHDPNRPNSNSQEGEFASSPVSSEDGTDGHSRREFLKIMGASMAMIGASACTRRPVDNIIPYVKRPENTLPGTANWYASTCGECESSCGILVKSREGRPIKFEGNPSHPVSQGGLCARGQASVLNLYDPDRLQAAINPGRKDSTAAITWDALDQKIVGKLRELKGSGGKIRFLTGEVTSPSTNKLIQEFMGSFGGAKRVTFEPLSSEEVLSAGELSYGTRVMPRYHFEKADMIVSFGADFLGTWGSPVEYNKGFSKRRKLSRVASEQGVKNPSLSRFVAFESTMTLTGANADERMRVKSGDEQKLAMALAHELIVAQGHSRFAGDSDLRGALTPYAAATVASQIGIPAEMIKKTAKELWENRGRSLVLGGGHTVKGDNGVALEVVVNLLNSALDNDGATVDGVAAASPAHSSYAELKTLIADMKAGQVDALFIYKSNPVYSLPKSLGFEEALSKVGMVVDFSMHFDETAHASDYVCALHHHTENWGDASPYAGLVSIQQPTISPLWKTRAFEECLLTWGKQMGVMGAIASAPNWHEYLKNNWKESMYRTHGGGAPFELFWEKVLREGLVHSAETSTHARSFSSKSVSALPKAGAASGVTLTLYPKVSMGDGRNSNNGWLQELPDPVTKITWDNYAALSVGMAKKLNLEEGDVVRLKTEAGTIEAPAHIQPGMHDETVALAVGYGRTNAGQVGSNVGVNAFALAGVGSHALAMSGIAVTVEKTAKHQDLASTQKHHSMEGRKIVREADYKEFKENPSAGNEEKEELVTIWPKHKYEGYRWAMAIDLNSCTGCSACMIGCQSENNIPVVGKQFVMSSREMHWLRIDRYYSGRVEQPEVVHQPMMCQHCENAPCETVCPVLATMHDHEGLNQQVYNRCVGTRYCANNCPYKVRRFNWFTFTDVAAPMNLVYNPDETVRTRGVMEKCTFCMQRIRGAKDAAKDAGRKVTDGEMKTACQQSCPTDAIIFGNINDKDSRVAKISEDPRGYHVLEELNVRPSITYLTKIRNT